MGPRVKELRQKAGLTLQQLSAISGLSFSAISKIENRNLSPTYENILKLADGLSVDITQLFSGTSTKMASGTRSVTRQGEGIKHSTSQYEYEMLCADITNKDFIPLLTVLKAHEVSEFPSLSIHEGQEFVFVMSGEVKIVTDNYTPLHLKPGDSCYFDSKMGHVLLSAGETDATILWVCSRVHFPLSN